MRHFELTDRCLPSTDFTRSAFHQALTAALSIGASSGALGQGSTTQPGTVDLAKTSLEDLMNIVSNTNPAPRRSGRRRLARRCGRPFPARSCSDIRNTRLSPRVLPFEL